MTAKQRIPPALDDPVRIVPLRLARELYAPAPGIAPPPPPHLTYRGGPVLSAVQVFTIFWGASWNDAPQQSTAAGLNRFLQFVVSSAYVDQLAEYNTPRHIPEALGDKTFHPFSDFLLHNVGTGDGIVMAMPEHYGRNVYHVLWREFSADSVARTRNKVRTAS